MPEKYSRTSPAELARLRREAGLDITAAGAYLGVSHCTVYYWEKGRHRISPEYEEELLELYRSVINGILPLDLIERGWKRARQRHVLARSGVSAPSQSTLGRVHKALDFIRSRLASEECLPPTRREIGEACGASAASAPAVGNRVVGLLADTGYIEGIPGRRNRSIRLTEKGKGGVSQNEQQ